MDGLLITTTILIVLTVFIQVKAVYEKEDCAALGGTCVPYKDCPFHIGACNAPFHHVCCRTGGVIIPSPNPSTDKPSVISTVNPPVTFTTRPPIIPDGGDKPNGPGCGISSYKDSGLTQIVNGTDASYGEFPWQVSMVYVNAWGFKVKHLCGGVLIHPQWVLTAAHCVHGYPNPNQWSIRLGSLYNSRKESHEVDIRVARVIKHEKYNHKTIDYDVALLKLEEAVTTNEYVNIACLADANDQYEGHICIASGWGNLRFQGTSPDRLQKVELPIINQQDCIKKYSDANVVTDRMICAGVPGGLSGTCQGDSGGPLACQKNDGKWYQIGITSWGVGCALPNRPGVYGRVAVFRDWIAIKMATN